MTNVATYHAAVDELDRKIHTLAKSINAQNYEMLTLIREFDERCRQLRQGSPESLKEARSVYAARGLRVSRP